MSLRGSYVIILAVGVVFLSFIMLIDIVFAEEKIIIILPNAGVPECVDDDSCLAPSTIYIEIGDTIILERETKVAHYFTGGRPEQAGTLPRQGYGGPYNESGVYYFYDQVHPWIVGKIVVGLTDTPEQTYEESKAKSEQIKQEMQQEQDAASLEGAKNYIEELKDKIQNLFDIISDLEFQIERLTIQNNNLKKQLEEELDDEIIVKSEKKSIASFVDKEKNPQDYIDRYNNEEGYKDWFHENYPDYKSIHEAVGKREPVPDWIRNNAKWWADGQISEDEFVNGIEYLVKQKIIEVE